MNLFIKLSTFAALCATLATFGGSLTGSEGGNGGGGEVEFVAIRTKITTWLDARFADGTLAAKLQLLPAQVSAAQFHALYHRFENAPVVFQDAPIALAGSSTAPPGRICANRSALPAIWCNNANWGAASAPIKYAIVLHETLGVAGLEANQGDYSQYPISKNILGYLQRFSGFELGVVANRALELRERFASARAPKHSELEGKKFRCTTHFATLDTPPFLIANPSSFEFSLLQDPKNSLILKVSSARTRLHDMETSEQAKEWMGIKETEIKTMWLYLGLRVEEASGKILFELSVVHPELQYGVPYLRPLIESVNLYDLKVWDYRECEVE